MKVTFVIISGLPEDCYPEGIRFAIYDGHLSKEGLAEVLDDDFELEPHEKGEDGLPNFADRIVAIHATTSLPVSIDCEYPVVDLQQASTGFSPPTSAQFKELLLNVVESGSKDIYYDANSYGDNHGASQVGKHQDNLAALAAVLEE